MFDRIRSWFTAPRFAGDEEKTRAAGLLHLASLIMAMVIGATLPILLVVYGLPPLTDWLNWSVIGSILVMFATNVGLLLIVRRGHVRLAGWILTSLFWLLVSFALFGFGGLEGGNVIGYPIVITLAGLLLGGQGALAYAGLSVLIVVGVYLVESLGILVYPPSILEPYDLIAVVGAIVLTGLLMRYAVASLNAAFGRARRDADALAAGNRELQAARAALEQSTKSLERRFRYLEASAEVSRVVSAILDPDELIRQVVDLIREKFGLYYVGLFLLDETAEWAVLRAGTGTAGQTLLMRAHRIRVGEGMVGWSVAHAQARIAQDVGADAVRLATQELPNTRTEAALPLRSRGRVLGALTVQSDQPAAFDQDLILVWQALADQLAVALDNACLFTESQAALEAERRAYGAIRRSAWQEMIQTRPDLWLEYICGPQGPAQPVERPWLPEMAQANRLAQVVRADDHTLAVPIKVYDQVLGVVRLRKPEQAAAWTSEEVSLVETLVGQLGVAVESARLYQDTQRRAVREQLVSEVSARLRASLDLDTVLQTTVRELGKAIGAELVAVEIAGPRSEVG